MMYFEEIWGICCIFCGHFRFTQYSWRYSIEKHQRGKFEIKTSSYNIIIQEKTRVPNTLAKHKKEFIRCSKLLIIDVFQRSISSILNEKILTSNIGIDEH